MHYGDKKIHHVQQQVVKLDKSRSSWSRFDIDVQTRDVELSEQEHRDIVDGVNNVYQFFDQVLYFDIYKTVPVNILILKNKTEYESYLRSIGKGRVSASYGVYFNKENRIVVYMRKNRQGTFSTIKHEVSHAVVDTITPYTPAWLNEGLAEQMETLERDQQGLYIKSHSYNRKRVARVLKSGELTGIDQFLKLPSDQWRHTLSDRNKGLQSQAGQFVFFLLSSAPNKNFIVRLMHKFERGSRKLSYYLVDDNFIGGVKGHAGELE